MYYNGNRQLVWLLYDKSLLIVASFHSHGSHHSSFRHFPRDTQSEHRIDSYPIGFHLISVIPMKSYRYPSHETTSRFLVLESCEILVSELDGI